jgi:putative membrane protein
LTVVADILVAVVALIQVYIAVLEMFLWKTPRARVAFGTPEFAEGSAMLAANQGLYNGFLAAALIYGLACVIVAGLCGAATSSKRILFVQVLPGALALIAVLLAR